MDDFRAKMNCSKQKMQLALFMTNGKFAVAEKIIGNNFNIKCLSPQDQGLAFDKDLDEIILSKKPPFMIHGYDSSAVSERYMMLKPFQ